jgi:hypothetical protein
LSTRLNGQTRVDLAAWRYFDELALSLIALAIADRPRRSGSLRRRAR